MNENSNMKDKFLYLGYIVHILTDLHYQWTVKKEYIEEMSKIREFIDHIDFYKEMIDDERDVSKQLLVSYPVLDDIKALLLSCTDYSIHPLFTCEELQRAKNWTIQMKLDSNSSINETTFVTYNRVLDFIDYSSNKILQELSPYITST
jgi:hypothetical protein